METMTSKFWPRLSRCVHSAVPAAGRTGLWLLLFMIPVSFAVLVMREIGALDVLANLARPAFRLIGLPGEAAMVFATSCLLNIYACIGVIETLELSGRTITILALMCLISHNLPVESAVLRKAGSSAGRMVALRLALSFAAGWALNGLLPAEGALPEAAPTAPATVSVGFVEAFRSWAAGITVLSVRILVLIIALMVVERILHEFGVTRRLAELLKYPLRLLGLPSQAAFLWVVANTLGLAYGAGVIIDHVRQGRLSRRHAGLLNHHIAISHSLLEDTMLFVAIGVSACWITIPRVLLAGMVVWLLRLTSVRRRQGWIGKEVG